MGHRCLKMIWFTKLHFITAYYFNCMSNVDRRSHNPSTQVEKKEIKKIFKKTIDILDCCLLRKRIKVFVLGDLCPVMIGQPVWQRALSTTLGDKERQIARRNIRKRADRGYSFRQFSWFDFPWFLKNSVAGNFMASDLSMLDGENLFISIIVFNNLQLGRVGWQMHGTCNLTKPDSNNNK